MRVFLSATALALLTSSLLTSQAGTFTIYGSGCPGTGNGATGCVSANWTQTFNPIFAGGSVLYALRANTGSSAKVICGIELLCKTRNSNSVNMNVWIYDKASSGAPGKALRSGSMPVTGTAKANRSTFKSLLVLPANTDFFIVYDNSVNLSLPIMKSGTAITFYHSGPNWQGPVSTLPWNYNVICCGASVVPTISSTGVPTIGKQFAIDLSNALPNAKALLAIGETKTNTDLTFAGAPGCTLLTNPLLALGVTTSNAGTFSLPQSVPNDSKLLGATFYTQFAVNDAVNALKLVFTAGGAGQVGK